eukprot:CAMPEP_0179251148 /NCGR_PEP_ID=MMETSP0797-20121207/21538_1 /TAXON_ID=47934 /ORGANISM="Dinophysis acuminata, Strain DAEP01" /LENGTH=354 /DNA_ID=CAMNT_0020958915 /DNA_START=122 /DNA_END=1186 /DNA_ORIENTATION=-
MKEGLPEYRRGCPNPTWCSPPTSYRPTSAASYSLAIPHRLQPAPLHSILRSLARLSQLRPTPRHPILVQACAGWGRRREGAGHAGDTILAPGRAPPPGSPGLLQVHVVQQGEDHEEQAAGEGDAARRQALAEPLAAEHREARADGVADDRAHDDAERVLVGGERDRGDLGAVPPLRAEREHQRLQEDRRAEPREHLPDQGLLRLRRALDVFLGQVVLDLLELFLLVLLLAPEADVHEAQPEEDVEDGGRGAHLRFRDEVGQEEAEEGGQDRHEVERRERAAQDRELRVPHGHNGRDDEGLVTELSGQDHEERSGEPLYRILRQLEVKTAAHHIGHEPEHTPIVGDCADRVRHLT